MELFDGLDLHHQAFVYEQIDLEPTLEDQAIVLERHDPLPLYGQASPDQIFGR